MKEKLRKLGVFLFWVGVWMCCVSLAYSAELSKEKLHARCASWAYLITNNLKDPVTYKHIKYTKGKMTLEEYMYETGYAEGLVTGTSLSMMIHPYKVASDFYNQHCLPQNLL